jgi:hypothetical protein
MATRHRVAAAFIAALLVGHAAARALDDEMDAVRRAYVELRRDALIADPATLVPAAGQIAIFISVDPLAQVTLETVSVAVDGHSIGQRHYSKAQADVLRRDTADRFFVGNVPAGAGPLAATFSGLRRDGKSFGVTFDVAPETTQAPQYLELRLSHTSTKGEPDVVLPVASPADLQYRAIMYLLGQELYEPALVQALAIDALSPDAAADVRYKLAEARAAFALRMRSVAQQTAAALDAEQLSAEDRIRVALLRGRDFQQRQDWAGLDGEVEYIGRVRGEIGTTPLPDVDAEVAFMRAELATARGEFVRAGQIIHGDIPARSGLRAFALFNLGVALRTSGDPSRSEQLFSELATMPVYTEDALDLKQRAQVALSMLKQQRTETASAEAVLRSAPAQGRYHQLVLASYARLAMDHGDYEAAASVWSTLLRESPWSTTGKAAQVAYPQSLENVAGPQVALKEYRRAETNFERRLDDLQTLAARTADPAWDTRLLRGLANLPDAPLDSAVSEWRTRLGHDDWLAWLSTDETQLLLGEWRELDAMTAWLATPGAGASDLAARARALTARVARLADDRRAQLAASLDALVQNEVQMAQRQLTLIRVGIARTTDRIAENPAAAGP